MATTSNVSRQPLHAGTEDAMFGVYAGGLIAMHADMASLDWDKLVLSGPLCRLLIVP